MKYLFLTEIRVTFFIINKKNLQKKYIKDIKKSMQ